MNHKKVFTVIFIAVVSALLFIAATEENAYISHQVKKGETVSLLCIEIYGYYSDALGKAFAADNPKVKNINLIYVGQNIRFRKPVQDAVAEKEDVADTVSVFRKKVDATQGVVTYVEGKACVTKKDAAAPVELTANSLVYPGDVLKTGATGRVELIINRESVVRMKENTELTIEAFRNMAKKEGKTSLNFSIGSVWSKMKKFKDSISRFELELPTAIAGVHGTVYNTTVNSDQSAEVKVYEGEVAVSGSKKQEEKAPVPGALHEIGPPREIAGPHEVSMEEWTLIVRSMQLITIDKQGVPSDATDFQKSAEDDWEQWNEERDKRIAEIFLER